MSRGQWLLTAESGGLGKGSQVSSDERKGCGLNYMSVDELACVILIQTWNWERAFAEGVAG